MNRNQHAAIFILCLGNSVFFAQKAQAIDAVYEPSGDSYFYFVGGNLEVQGFNGRIDLPLTLQAGSQGSFPFTIGDVAGAAANDTTLFTLINDEQSATDNSLVVMSDAQTGAYLGQVQLNARVADIAYTNGQLYGVLPNQNALQIDSIASNGTTQSVVNLSEPSFTGTWRLSGVVSGNNLLASHGTTTPNAIGYLVSPISPQQASQITVFGPPAVTLPLLGTVFSADGNTVSYITSGEDAMTSLPADTYAGIRSSSYGIGNLNSPVVSDEFAYTYAPSQPATVTLATYNSSGLSAVGTDGLFRLPQVVSATLNEYLWNGVAPDGVTLSNVSASNLLTQTGGPTPVTISEQDASSGDFSSRSLGTTTLTLNLATAQRGFYEFSMNPNITADYSYGSTVDVGRTVQHPNYGGGWFGYDPVSANIVGNGDASLQATGWEFCPDGDTGSWESQGVPATSRGFLLYPSVSMRQILQLPTPNQPMLLSFTGADYNDTASPPVEVQVDLNGIMVDDVFVDSTSPQTFSTEITDPALQNLNNAVLMFYLPGNHNSLLTGVALDDISLTALPEPATSASAVLLGGIFLGRRRNRGN
ncbi:MAG: hypothetical protein ABSC42_02860 [Tepidisphaeraceae bacterium]|jgi:hypothetical protein